ncbi:BLUF domain-containing protein [Sphingosinicellaceae bacterium]|nr:BLUF domain-containing protein [Sphingosinicellaceae bacterium]
MSTYTLVYVSKAVGSAAGVDAGREVDAILTTARRKNVDCGVTGALLVTEGRFVQALEGERDAVQATFDRISLDPRHENIEVLSSQFADRPRFTEWSMAFVGDTPALRDRFADAPLAALGRRQTGDAMLDFMLDVARSPDDDY